MAKASAGRLPVARTSLRFAVYARHSVIWALKAAGLGNMRPGRNEVSEYWFARSTMPLNSGSRAGANTIRVASVPANPAHLGGRFAGAADRRLPIQNQRLRHPAPALDDLPHPSQKITVLPGREHHRRNQP